LILLWGRLKEFFVRSSELNHFLKNECWKTLLVEAALLDTAVAIRGKSSGEEEEEEEAHCNL
jgi:hypothetical protein